MRRGCLWGAGGVLGLLLLCCALGWFVAIPRVRDGLRNSIADGLATNVAEQLATRVPAGERLDPGTYTISVAAIEDEIAQGLNQPSIEGVRITTAGDELAVVVESGGQAVSYRGRPLAQDGRLVMADMRTTSDLAGFFVPPDSLGDAIELGVNRYLETQGLRIDAIELAGEEIVLRTSGVP